MSQKDQEGFILTDGKPIYDEPDRLNCLGCGELLELTKEERHTRYWKWTFVMKICPHCGKEHSVEVNLGEVFYLKELK